MQRAIKTMKDFILTKIDSVIGWLIALVGAIGTFIKFLHSTYRQIMDNTDDIRSVEERLDELERIADSLENIEEQQSVLQNDMKWLKKEIKS